MLKDRRLNIGNIMILYNLMYRCNEISSYWKLLCGHKQLDSEVYREGKDLG